MKKQFLFLLLAVILLSSCATATLSEFPGVGRVKQYDFYSYDIPSGEDRGAHAHKECHQLIIAASGSFEVVLDDGTNKRTVLLNRPFWGLHVPPGIWASEQGFSSGSICLVLASHGYSEEDYIRNYDEFLKYVERQRNNRSIGTIENLLNNK